MIAAGQSTCTPAREAVLDPQPGHFGSAREVLRLIEAVGMGGAIRRATRLECTVAKESDHIAIDPDRRARYFNPTAYEFGPSHARFLGSAAPVAEIDPKERRMRTAVSTAGCFAVLILVAAVAVAQNRTDFSGLWTPAVSARPPSRPVPDPDLPPQPKLPPPNRLISITIKQSATELRVDLMMLESEGREVVHPFIYNLDGSESVNQMGTAVHHTKVTWEGEALVLSSAVFVDGDPIGETRDVYRITNTD